MSAFGNVGRTTRFLMLAVLTISGALFLPHCAMATTASQALASCNHEAASTTGDGSGGTAGCVFQAGPPEGYKDTWLTTNPPNHNAGAPAGGFFQFTGATLEGQCAAIAPWSMTGDADLPGGQDMCIPGSGGGSGLQGCAFHMTQQGNAFQNSSGKWKAKFSVSPQGGICTRSADGKTWTFGNGTASSTPTAVPSPATLPAVPTISPQLCNGGSCYDPNTGNACAVIGGGQACFNVQSMQPGQSGCSNGGGGALCAGEPSAPLPPNPPITDPATQIRSTDSYPVVSAAGAGGSITVNVFAPSGVTTNSGQQSGDSGPAPASSAGGDGTSASGGRDCNSPPICEGAAATCMVVTQTYLIRCPPSTPVGPGEADSDQTVPGLDGYGSTLPAANQSTQTLLDKLDTGGLSGGGTCPRFAPIDIPMFNIHWEEAPDWWCNALHAAGVMILLLAAFISMQILADN